MEVTTSSLEDGPGLLPSAAASNEQYTLLQQLNVETTVDTTRKSHSSHNKQQQSVQNTGSSGLRTAQTKPDRPKPTYTKSSTMNEVNRSKFPQLENSQLQKVKKSEDGLQKGQTKTLLATKQREEVRNSRDKPMGGTMQFSKQPVSGAARSDLAKKSGLSTTLPILHNGPGLLSRKPASGLESILAKPNHETAKSNAGRTTIVKPSRTVPIPASQQAPVSDKHKLKKGQLARPADKPAPPEPKKVNPLLAEPPKPKKTKMITADTEEMSDMERSESPDKPSKIVFAQKIPKNKFIQNAASFEEWKRKNGLDLTQKIFIISGGLNDLKHSMISRGWVENPDQTSPFYDFKWAIKSKDIIFSEMWEFQLVNHFSKNTTITTKSGLASCLRNINTFHDIHPDSFFPRCYNFNEAEELEDFQFDDIFTQALSLCRRYERYLNNKDVGLSFAEEDAKKSPAAKTKMNPASVLLDQKPSIAGSAPLATTEDLCRLIIALLSVGKRGLDIDEVIDLENVEFDPNIQSDEWEVIKSAANPVIAPQPTQMVHKGSPTPPPKTTAVLSVIGATHKLLQKYLTIYSLVGSSDLLQTIREKLQPLVGKHKQTDSTLVPDLLVLLEAPLSRVFSLLKQKDTQFGLYQTEHLWIMKPGTSSRGRGIEVFADYDKILERRANNRDIPWVCQKYMENSLLVKKRKFDIRQWVLVTDWNPLVVWFYEDCYVRFSCVDYDPTDMSAFVHLTNNSISKHKKIDFNSEEQKFFGKNMWSSDHFAEYLKTTYGRDVYGEKIKPKIRDIVLWTMSSSQDIIENRKNSMELYGLDLMVDDDFETYLIEVNSSPSMEHSTPITSKLVQEVSEDVIKVTVDNNNGRKKVLGDTGKFTCLVRGKQPVTKPTFHMKVNWPVIGQKIADPSWI